MAVLPKTVKLFWKLRRWRINQAIEGAENLADYINDTSGLEGIQNQGQISNILHDPASEDVNLFAVSVSARGVRLALDWVYFPGEASLTAGVGSVEQALNLDAVPGGWGVGTILEIGDELCTVTAVNGFEFTVRRRDHGTPSQGHSSGAVVRQVKPSHPMFTKTLDEVLTDGGGGPGGPAVISAPSNLVAVGKVQSIQLTWDSNLSEAEFLLLKTFRVFFGEEGTFQASPPIPPSPDPGDINHYQGYIDVGREPRYTYFPPNTSRFFFRVTAVDINDRITALSNEANATADQVIIVDPAKPDPPNVGLAPQGGNQESGWVLLVGVQVSGGPGDSGVTRIQFQIAREGSAWSSTAGFTDGIITYPGGGLADEIVSGQRFQSERTVAESSASFGRYALTARVFNESGQVWSDWAVPDVSGTAEGTVDADVPKGAGDLGEVFFAMLNAESSLLGNMVKARVSYPKGNQLSIWGLELQATDDLANWPLSSDPGPPSDIFFRNCLGLVPPNIKNLGFGNVVHGSRTMTNVENRNAQPPGLVENELAGKVLYAFHSADQDAGWVTGAYALLIESNTADAGGFATITVKGSNPPGWPETFNSKAFRVANGWLRYKFRKTFVRRFGQLVSLSGDPNGDEWETEAFPITESLYWRVRFGNRAGLGQWLYYTGGVPSLNRDAAVLFDPTLAAEGFAGNNAIVNPNLADDSVNARTIIDGGVIARKLTEKNRGFTLKGTFSAVDFDTVAWAGLELHFPGESPFLLLDGNTGDMTGQTFLYWDADFPTSVLLTTNILDLDAEDRVFLCYAEPGPVSGFAFFIPAQGGFDIIADRVKTPTLEALQAIVGQVSVLAGQDITFITSDLDPSRLIWGVEANGAEIYNQTGTAGLNIVPKLDASNYLWIGNDDPKRWGFIGLRASRAVLPQVSISAADSSSSARYGVLTVQDASIILDSQATAAANRVLLVLDSDAPSLSFSVNNNNVPVATFLQSNIYLRRTVSKQAGGDVASIGTAALRYDGGYFDLVETLQVKSPTGDDLELYRAAVLKMRLGSTSVRFFETLRPDVHNTLDIGTATVKFATIHSVSTNFGDVGFANQWAIRELGAKASDSHRPASWFKRHASKGLVWYDDKGRPAMVLRKTRKGHALEVAGVSLSDGHDRLKREVEELRRELDGLKRRLR